MLKKLLTESVLYGVSHVLTRLIGYLLVILHTAIFEAAAYGIVALFYSWIALFNILYTFGLETTFFRFANQKDTNPRQVFTTLFTFLFVIGGTLTLLLVGFSAPLSAFFNYPHARIYIIIGTLILGVDSLAALPFARLRLEHKVRQFVGLKILNVLINVGLNVYFLWYCPRAGGTNLDWSVWFYEADWGVAYVFIANLSANFLVLGYFLPRLNLQPALLVWQDFKQYGRYAYPLVLSGFAFVINELADRILLESWLPDGYYENLTSLDAVGIYSACYKLSIFISISVQAFKYAAEPFFFKHAADRQSPRYFAAIMTYFVVFCAVVFCAVSINLDWISRLFLRQKVYRQGLAVVPILLMANIFLGIYYNLSIWFKYTNRTYWAGLLGLAGILITLIVNYFAIPLWGYLGSAVATLMCYMTIAVLSYWVGRKYYPVPYALKSIILALLGAVFFVYISSCFLNIYLKNSLLLVLVAFLILCFKDSKHITN